MTKLFCTILIIVGTLFAIASLACQPEQTAIPTVEPTPTQLPTDTPAARATVSNNPTPKPTPTPTQVPTDIPDALPTISNSPTPEPTPTPSFALYEGSNKEYFDTNTFELITQGDRLARQGDYQQALPVYKEAQEQSSEPSRVIHNRLGTAYYALGDYQMAIDHYTASLAVEETGQGYLSRATVFFEQGDCNAAAKDAQSTLSYQSIPFHNRNTHFNAHSLLAACKAYDGYPDAARRHAKEALNVAQTSNLPPDIIDELKSQIDLIGQVDPLLPHTQRLVSEAVDLLESGSHDQAIQKLKEALKTHGKPSSDIHHLIGAEYHYNGNYAEAIEHYSIAIATRPHPDSYLGRADVYYAQNQCALAISDADRSLYLLTTSTDPAYIQTEANFIKALCMSYSGDLQEALEHLEQAISHAKQAQYTPEAFQDLTNRKDEWESSLSGLNKEYFHPITHNHFQEGETHLTQGHLEEALEAFRQAVNTHPYPSRILQSRIAITYQALGQNDKAVDHHTIALQVQETSLGLSNRASAYAATGQCTLATADAEASLTSNNIGPRQKYTEAQSHAAIATCAAQNSDLPKALHHIDIAISSALSSDSDPNYIQLLEDLRSEWSAENKP